MSVTLRLEDALDVARGNMIVRKNNQTETRQDIEAILCWLHKEPLNLQARYSILHTTHFVRGRFQEVQYRIDVNTLHRDKNTSQIGLNDIARVSLRTTEPLFCDSYRKNRSTGSFIVIDENTHVTVGAGMILD